VLAQRDGQAVLTEALNVVGRVEDALVLAAAADRDERHLCMYELAERAAAALVMAVWSAHAIALSGATSAETLDR
jgi:hypothetical protein